MKITVMTLACLLLAGCYTGDYPYDHYYYDYVPAYSGWNPPEYSSIYTGRMDYGYRHGYWGGNGYYDNGIYYGRDGWYVH